MTEIVVTGVNGFIGRHVQAELRKRGFEVRGLVRTRQHVMERSGNNKYIEVDYEDPSTLLDAISGADIVVHLVGHTHARRADVTTYERVNAEYSRRVVRAAASAGVHRVVYLSSIKVLGNGGEDSYSELTLPKPEDVYGRSKLEAEIAIRTLALSSGVDHVILRPPLVYGAGVKGNLRTLIAAVERGRPIPVARSGRNARSLISARNLASAIADVVGQGGKINSTYVLSDSTLSSVELVEMIAHIAGKRLLLVPLPPGLLRSMAETLHRRSAVDGFLRSLRVDPTLFTQRFDWHPEQSVEEGFREAVETYRLQARDT